jgi:ABC-type dipeptide/oligopeptide/nickel transport system permease component
VWTYVARRLLLAAPTLVGVSLVAFVLVALAPGDAAQAALGTHFTPEQYQRERQRLGLDRPLPVRYARWAGHVLRGDLGSSTLTKRPVADELSVRWPATAELATSALLLASLVGVLAGVTSATRRGGMLDHVAMTTSLAGVSLPIFWLGGILLLMATSIDPEWPTGFRLPSKMVDFEPVTGFYVLDCLLRGEPGRAIVVVKHLALPALALGTIPMAIIGRMTRSSMLEALSQDYVRTARAKGLSRTIVEFRHALRNAMVPVVTVIGLQFGALLGGAIITERIFSWPGLGNWILTGVAHRDESVIQAGVLVISAGYVFINLAVDLLYLAIDPRIRHA